MLLVKLLYLQAQNCNRFFNISESRPYGRLFYFTGF